MGWKLALTVVRKLGGETEVIMVREIERKDSN
jgi:hypothetical protein